MGNCGEQKAQADGNGKGSEDNTIRVTKKARATRARVSRATAGTSPREEGDDGHNNQLGI